MKTKQTLSPAEVEIAQALYREFSEKHPDQHNPGNINTPEKANFLAMKGFEKIRLLQLAREQGLPLFPELHRRSL